MLASWCWWEEECVSAGLGWGARAASPQPVPQGCGCSHARGAQGLAMVSCRLQGTAGCLCHASSWSSSNSLSPCLTSSLAVVESSR